MGHRVDISTSARAGLLRRGETGVEGFPITDQEGRRIGIGCVTGPLGDLCRCAQIKRLLGWLSRSDFEVVACG